jgi:hypothetical protein
MTTPFEPGTRFGDLEQGYDIVRLLREEPAGPVYEATAKGGRAANLRILEAKAAEKALRLAGLVRELGHAHVAQVLAAGTHEGKAFIATDAVAGESLAELIARVGALPVDRAVEILVPLVAAVAAGHARGIARAELTPARVRLPRNEHGAVVPTIVDLGLPQAGPAEQAYLAPEHDMPGLAAEPGCDQYVLGLLLYEAVTGKRPTGPTIAPPSEAGADVPPDLDAVIVRALKLRAVDRFASVIAFGRALLPFASSKVAAAWETRLVLVAPPPVEKAPPPAKGLAPGMTPALVAPGQVPTATSAVPPTAALEATGPVSEAMPAAAFAAASATKPVPRTALLPAPDWQRPLGGVLGTKIDEGFDEEAGDEPGDEPPAPPREPAMNTRRLDDSMAGAENSFTSELGDERSLSVDRSLAIEGPSHELSNPSLELAPPRRQTSFTKRARPPARWLPWVIGIGGILVGAAGAGLFLTLSQHEHEAPVVQSPPPPPVVAPPPVEPPPAVESEPAPSEAKIRPARRKAPQKPRKAPYP